MIFTATRSDLRRALKAVSATVTKKGDAIESHYLLRLGATGAVEILSHTGRAFASCPVRARVERVGSSFTIASAHLTASLSNLTDATIVRISGGQDENTATFPSLDPALFPDQDHLRSGAQRTAVIGADRLHSAFKHARSFVYAEEQKAPQLCVAEFRNGNLFSTDHSVVSIVRVAGMEQSAIRVYKDDFGSLLAFLGTCGCTEVEVWESDEKMFVKRDDGAIFGSSKYEKRFPDVTVDWTVEDDHSVDLPKAEVVGAVSSLAAAARSGNTVLRLDAKKAGLVVLSMTSTNGKPVYREIKATGQASRDGNVEALPDGGLAVSNAYFMDLVKSCSAPTVRLGIAKKGKGGWLRLKDERGPDTYLTTLAWLRGFD